MDKSPIKIAAEACGSQTSLAKRIGVTLSTVNQWVNGYRPVSPARCIAIEEACNGAVTRHDLRPDVFGEVA